MYTKTGSVFYRGFLIATFAIPGITIGQTETVANNNTSDELETAEVGDIDIDYRDYGFEYVRADRHCRDNSFVRKKDDCVGGEAYLYTKPGFVRDYVVDIQEVHIRYDLNGHLYTEVRYAYDFEGLDEVFIEGFGLMAAKGELAYLSYGDLITFRNPENPEQILYICTFQEHFFGPPLTDYLPEVSQFPKAGRLEVWKYPTALTGKIVKVLNGKSISYAPEFTGSKCTLRTKYTRLKGTSGKKIAEISILISHPYKMPGDEDNYYYKLQYLNREKKSAKDRWSYNCLDDVEKISEEFVATFINELNELGGGPK